MQDEDKEREICDPKVMGSLINKASACRLTMCEECAPYVVPLRFGYEKGALY